MDRVRLHSGRGLQGAISLVVGFYECTKPYMDASAPAGTAAPWYDYIPVEQGKIAKLLGRGRARYWAGRKAHVIKGKKCGGKAGQAAAQPRHGRRGSLVRLRCGPAGVTLAE